MAFRERALYHQTHRLKLATDWGTGVLAAVWLWQHRLAPALVVGVVPSVLVSAFLVRYADLRRERDSAFGRYVARHMTRAVEVGRLAGCAVFWAALGCTRRAWLPPEWRESWRAGWPDSRDQRAGRRAVADRGRPVCRASAPHGRDARRNGDDPGS